MDPREMQATYEQMKAQMQQMKKDIERLSSEITVWKEQVHKLQEEVASIKASKQQCSPNGSLKPGSIGYFSTLVNKFYSKFKRSLSLEKYTSGYYGILKKLQEPIRNYHNRFNKEMIRIKDLDTKTAIECFKKGLILRSKLYNCLTVCPCSIWRSQVHAQEA